MQQEAGELVKHRKKYEHFKQMLFLLDGSEETFKPDTDEETEELFNLQKPENLKQEMDTDESESSCRVKKQLFPHHLSGHLIRAIKERPDLYKRTSNTNKSYKHGLWREVCKEVNPSWSQLPQKRKAEYCKYFTDLFLFFVKCLIFELIIYNCCWGRLNLSVSFFRRHCENSVCYALYRISKIFTYYI